MSLRQDLKREWAEIRSSEAHLQPQPPPASAGEALERLCDLAQRAGAGFRIAGDTTLFQIRSRALNGLKVFLLAVILFWTWAIAAALTAPGSAVPWLLTGLLLAAVVANARYGRTTYRITCDRVGQTLLLQSNDVLGRCLQPAITVPFGTIASLSATRTTGSGTSAQRLWLHRGDGRKLLFLSLPYGPWHYVNHQTFLDALERLLQRDDPRAVVPA